MTKVAKTPGANAAHAYRLGLRAAAIVGLALIGTLYWFGVIELLLAGYALLLLFPVYLVFAAAVLSVWLGYSKDATALRPVYKRN
jgi:hypothetical protein